MREFERRVEQRSRRSVVLAIVIGARQHPSDSRPWRAKHLFEPSIERPTQQGVRFVLRSDLEQRIDAGLDRPLLEQVAAERMDRADARLFELFERSVEARVLTEVGCIAATMLDLFADAELEFAGGFLGECNRYDLVQRGAAGGDHRDDSPHQLGGLAGARCGFDHRRYVELAGDPVARGLIGERHGISLSFRNSARRPGGFILDRRSSYGPQSIR